MRLIDLIVARDPGSVAASLPKFVVSNVANYLMTREAKAWDWLEFPYPRPPYDNMWVEYEHSREHLAVKSIEGRVVFGCMIRKVEGAASWKLGGYLVQIIDKKIHATGPPRLAQFSINSEGTPCDIFFPPVRADQKYWPKALDNVKKFEEYVPTREEQPRDEEKDVVHSQILFTPIICAMSFANCRNIEIVRVEQPPKLAKANAKRGKPKANPYHVINILPFGKVFASQRRVVTSDGKIDVEIRRGSYARYGPQHNRGLLFGKYEGVFWRPGRLAGGKADYAVKVKS